jgi:predicted AlkP superfamily phosphohydrolase/phosphomutase
MVVALDGATPDLVETWAQAGHLPTLKRLMDQGVSGSLRSTFPPLTGPAWSSFMTGKSAGHHGVLEFFHPVAGSYQQALNSRLDIDGKSLWRILSDAGRDVGVVGIPLTYPPEPVNGCLITGLLTPPDARDFAYPSDLLQELEAHLGPYRLRHDEKYRKADPNPFLREQEEILEYNVQTALYLMDQKPWDFFIIHFYGSDRIQHEFWHLLDPDHPQHDPEERARLGNVVLDFYRRLDSAVARLEAALDEDTVLMVMSDHGFGPIHQFFNVNSWLLKQGYLKLKPHVITRVRRVLFELGLNYSVAARGLLRFGLGRRAAAVGRARRETLQRRLFLSLDDVDWSRSRAYSLGNLGQLYVNLKGREAQGIVEPGAEYDALLDELSQALRALTDPGTGQPIVDRIFRREEVYAGPYAATSPDLAFLTKEMVTKPMGLSDFPSPRVFEPVYGSTGHHRMDGILICGGEGFVQQGARIDRARIQDLAPTILYLMDVAIPQEMDGVVLSDMFTQTVLARQPVIAPAADPSLTGPGEGYKDEDEAKLMEMLRRLGYVT